MTSNEFYNVLMKDVDYILNGGFVVNTDAFMQTMSYASEQYEVLKQKINSFEEQIQELIEKYSVLSDKYNNISDLVVELRQQNTALQLSNSNLSKILDEATYSLRCEELKVSHLEKERANMQATHQSNISQLQARIKDLEEHKTCDGCKHENMEEGDGLYHVYCGNCLRIHVDEFEPKDTK